MSDFITKLNVRSTKMVKANALSTFFRFLMMVIFMVTTSFTTVGNENSTEEPIPFNNCDNPLENALAYNAFVRYEAHLKNGDTEGPIAIGGDLTMKGIITIAAQTSGSNYFNGDAQASSLVVGGKVIYDTGDGIHLNTGFVKVGDLNGSSVFDTDLNNASANTRLTSSGYETFPRVDQNNKITLTQGQVNVLNLTGSKVLSMPYLTFENQPNANTPLIINVDVAGDFDWNVFNINAIGDQHGRFIIWNFFNASTVTLEGGGTLVGSLFAPKANVIKNSSGNINGQVIAKNYYHNSGELHQHPFEGCVETPATQCQLTVDAGDDVILCEEGEVTLTASVSGESECVDCTGVFGVEDTDHCNRDQNYVLWLKGGRYFSNVDLEWMELADGTATLKGTVFDYTVTQSTYEVDAVFSGKTTATPIDSPKDHLCHSEDDSAWTYYTDFVGTITSTDGSWSIDISRRGPAFQLGNGANQTETQQGKYGACGWFDTTDAAYSVGDFNINLGECVTTSTSEVSYLWSTGETTPSITVSSGGTYTVTVADCQDCEVEDSVDVTISSLDVDAGEDQEICKGESVVLTATATGETECTDCTGVYGVENTNLCDGDQNYVLWLNRGRYFSNVDLEWKELADGTATLTGTILETTNTQMTYEVDAVFSGRTTTAPADSPKEHSCNTEDANGWVYYTDFTGTITSTDGSWSTNITKKGSAFQIGNGANNFETEQGKYGGSGWFDTTDPDDYVGDFNLNLVDCINTSANQTSYLWSTGETTQSIIVSPEVDTTYTVTITGCDTCEASDDVNVVVNDAPVVDAGEDQEICTGESVVLTANTTGDSNCDTCLDEYSIENTDLCNQTDEDFVVCLVNGNQLRFFSNVDLVWKENQDGTASLKGTVLDHTITNEEYELDVTFSGKNTSGGGGHICNQEDNTGWAYYSQFSGSLKDQMGTWSIDLSKRGRAFQLGNGANAGERRQGKYGASGGFSTTDTQYTRGDININIGDCTSGSSSNFTYLWSTGETTQSITVSPEIDTNYTVSVTGCNACGEATDDVNVKVTTAVVDAGEDVSVQVGGSATLTASEADSYEWSTGATTQSILVFPTETTIYTVTVMQNGCVATDDVTVSVDGCSATVDAGEDQVVCTVGDEVVLTASQADSYEWSTGETTQSITVAPTETTVYTINAVVGGCVANDTVTVTISDLVLELGTDITACKDQPLVLTSPVEADTYLWSTGETTMSITVIPTGFFRTYSLEVTKDGCVASDSLRVLVEICEIGNRLGENEVRIFPTVMKPNETLSLAMNSKTDQMVTVSVHDLSGAVVGPVKSQKMESGDAQMMINLNEFSKLSSGVYMVRILGEGFEEIKRFVVN